MAARSGVITVTTAGTAVAGPSTTFYPNNAAGAFYVKAHPNNTDTVWVGNDGAGDVAAANGFPLDPGEGVTIYVNKLSELWFDADVNGEKLCWLAANAPV